MATGKYFVQPLLAQLLQKREGNGPAGLSYLPEISDVSNIPDGVNYFYYTGEDHDQFVNGYIYKHFKGEETIIVPEHREQKTVILPQLTEYIDVLEPGFAYPVGRYYKVPETDPRSIDFWVTDYSKDGVNYKSSKFDILQVGDYVWNADRSERYKITAIDHDYWNKNLTIENGVNLTPGGEGGSNYPEYAYVNAEGLTLWFANSMVSAGVGSIREYVDYRGVKSLYMYCDGLYSVMDTARRNRAAEPVTFTYIDIIPEHSETVEIDEYRQHDAQPRTVSKIESTDGSKYVLVEDSGATIAGDVTALNNFTVKGDLLVEGKEVVTDVETVQSENDFIKLRFNNPAAIGEGQSGLQILNFDGNGAVMYLVVSGDGILRLGLGNELEPVTTRDEAEQMVDGAVTVWNAAAQKIKTGPAAADLVTSEEIKTVKALSQAAFDAITTKDINTMYVII